MLTTARGVSLGLGKIKLADLNANLRDRGGFLKARQESQQEQDRGKIIIKKHVDSATLWAACRAVVFGSIIIIVGILMTILGYFDVDLSQEIVRVTGDGIEEVSINWTKRYLLKSLQYLGPVVMGVGSFILIIACVTTLENRDKNTQIFHDVKDGEPGGKKKSLLQGEAVRKRLPMTNEEIRDWTPQYKAVPLARLDSSPMLKRPRYRSTPCIPQTLLDAIDTRKLYERLLDNFYSGVFYAENDVVPEAHEHGRACTSTSEFVDHTSPVRQNVTVEIHNPPPALLLSAMPTPPSRGSSTRSSQHQSSPHLVSSSAANSNRISDLIYIENNSNNIIFSIDDAAANTTKADPTTTVTTTTTVATSDVRPLVPGNGTIPEESGKRAPLASLDIEFNTSSSSSSPNISVPDVESFFAI